MKPSKFHGLNRRWVNTHPAHGDDVHWHCSQQVIFFPHTATCSWHTLLFERLKSVTFNACTPVKKYFLRLRLRHPRKKNRALIIEGKMTAAVCAQCTKMMAEIRHRFVNIFCLFFHFGISRFPQRGEQKNQLPPPPPPLSFGFWPTTVSAGLTFSLISHRRGRKSPTVYGGLGGRKSKIAHVRVYMGTKHSLGII